MWRGEGVGGVEGFGEFECAVAYFDADEAADACGSGTLRRVGKGPRNGLDLGYFRAFIGCQKVSLDFERDVLRLGP